MGTWWEALLCPVINHGVAPYPSQTRSTLLSWFTGGEWKVHLHQHAAYLISQTPQVSLLRLRMSHPPRALRETDLCVSVCEDRWGFIHVFGCFWASPGPRGSSPTHQHAIFLASTCCLWSASDPFWVHVCHSHFVIKCCISSRLWLDYRSRHKVAAVITFCELMQVENLSSEDQVWAICYLWSLCCQNESVSNVDRWWNIHSLTVDHIRVWLFVSFCFPTLICLRYTFPGSLTNTHQLQHRWSRPVALIRGRLRRDASLSFYGLSILYDGAFEVSRNSESAALERRSYRTLLSSIILGYIPVCKMLGIIYYLKTMVAVYQGVLKPGYIFVWVFFFD